MIEGEEDRWRRCMNNQGRTVIQMKGIILTGDNYWKLLHRKRGSSGVHDKMLLRVKLLLCVLV